MFGVRLEFPMAEFFANGGVTTFIDNMAGALGIHRADLRVVAVYEGSTIIDFAVINEWIDEQDTVDFEAVKETFESFVTTVDTFMGSTILNAVSVGIPIVTPNTPTTGDDDINFEDIFNF